MCSGRQYACELALTNSAFVTSWMSALLEVLPAHTITAIVMPRAHHTSQEIDLRARHEARPNQILIRKERSLVADERATHWCDTPVAPAHALDMMTSERLPHFEPLVLGALTMLPLSASLELPPP